jgi:hypothetical protein
MRPAQHSVQLSWMSLRYQAGCVALSFFRFDGASRPAHQRVTLTVERAMNILLAGSSKITLGRLQSDFAQGEQHERIKPH